MMNLNVKMISALIKRDLRLFFTNPSGYVFITLFIFLSAGAAFWQEQFFLNNLASLSRLNAVFPVLLVFFIAALTMNVWAEENKQGTDELLLTLPATDAELVLGKYFAVLGVYAASLVLSLSHIVVLFFLGSPDIGLMFANYFGYFISGAALISVGMIASMLTANATIAFILGVVFTGLLASTSVLSGLFGDALKPFIDAVSIRAHFEDFSRGVLSFSAIFYFFSIAAFGLYINIILLGKRHWPKSAGGMKMSGHHAIRAISLIVALVSLNMIFQRFGFRWDVTSEKLHSLSGETRRLLGDLPGEKTVLVQAFISPEVPQVLVQTRSNLLSFLKEIEASSGGKVQVLIKETEPYSDEAREAREKFGITPREVVANTGAMQAVPKQIYMGLAFTCGAEEQVIDFFDKGLPVEYELIRSIRVVSKSERKKIGVVKTAAKIFGGFDFQTMQNSPEWQVVSELKKQYEVVEISADSPIEEQLDGLLVVLPSSLSQEEMDNLAAFIEAGNPALVLTDPLFLETVALSPSEKSGAEMNPFLRNQGMQPKPKGNIQGFMRRLGFNWNPQEIVWDSYNPHPELATLPPEVIFIGEGNRNPDSFNKKLVPTQGLQELVFLFPGFLEMSPSGSYGYEPLISCSEMSGRLNYRQLVQRSYFGVQMVPSRMIPHQVGGVKYTLAARAFSDNSDSTKSKTKLNVITVADIDFISEQFFDIRKSGYESLNFDNVTFFLNCMDWLAGDESFIELRKKRLKHRTLETLEKQVMAYAKLRRDEEKQAELEAEKALSEAQDRLNNKVAEMRRRTDLDEQTKQIMARNIQEVESRRFEALKSRIEAEKDAKIQRSKENMEARVQTIQSTIKLFAVLLPPIPVGLMAVMIFMRRRRREKAGTAVARRRRQA
ncbi:putative permease of ABC transporter [Chloroherpeton thalassium ATCC 35110]|uniref:Putative permease of ABC transporter n=1 Tax=Chloroherpeton thalassium (strain ATCC 35110 / GB-78) TaxID=517418 RepID=B3QTZ0_CHLT3|nr:Gldg family protein [Chloroherpeton thalassium]ACF12788.1 putative permease of ABC transporter [Chloroherpeton thalassium ATCC 35110]